MHYNLGLVSLFSVSYIYVVFCSDLGHLLVIISAAFIGFDNHRKSVLFGVALLYDETASTFDWLFTTFLKCMSNKKP